VSAVRGFDYRVRKVFPALSPPGETAIGTSVMFVNNDSIPHEIQ
jgi:hypothetical protein